MCRIPPPRVWLVALLLSAVTLVDPPSAHADRVDVDDPSLLGPLLRREFLERGNDFETAIAEVRYAGGIYSYIYAVSSTPYFPFTSCCEAGIVSFAVTGHPLEDTWGAINGSDAFWNPHPGTTRRVTSITPLHDGFLVVPEGPGRFTVMYMQSPLPPSRDGILTYTGRVRDFDSGSVVVRTESFDRGDVLVPAPEPGSIILFGLGLAGLAVKRRASRQREGARPR